MNTVGTRNQIWIAVFMGASLLAFQNCSAPEGFRLRNTAVADEGKGEILQQNGGTSTDNPKPTVSLQIGEFASTLPPGTAAPKILLCVSEIRFEKLISSPDPNAPDSTRIRIPDENKLVELKPDGTLIDVLNIPVGNYGRIELRLRADCGGVSAAVTNANGEIQVNSDMDVRFAGSISNNGNLSKVVLNMDQMISRLATATRSRQIERALTDSEGGCGGD